ncbi:MAG TPA: hypothetical protein VGC36_04715, partial [Rhizomicrobium sp.]
RALEERFHITITISADITVSAQVSYIVERGEQMHTPEAAKAIAAAAPPMPTVFEEDDFVEPEEDEAEDDGEEMIAAPSSIEVIETEDDADDSEPQGESGERDGGQRRKRRRGRGRGRGGEGREGSGREGSGREGSPREPREVAAHDVVAEHAVSHEDHDDASPGEDGIERPQRAEGAQETPGAEGAEGDIRRRRRRGRRGGRRNRHRDGEAPGQSGNGNDVGVDGQDARHDTGFAPEGREPAYAPHNELVSAPAYAAPVDERPAQPIADSHAPAQEPPRRRSTIREPAPFAAGGAPAPAPVLPQPVVVSTAADEPAQPKRGWWGKRLLGDNS